jgi:hypothetical protein
MLPLSSGLKSMPSKQAEWSKQQHSPDHTASYLRRQNSSFCIHIPSFDRFCGLVVSSWVQIQRSWVRFPVLPDFQRNSESGTGSTQPREYNWGATWKKSSGSGLEIRDYGCRDPSRWPRGTLYPQKLALSSPTSGGHSVGIVRWRAQAKEFVLFVVCPFLRTIYWVPQLGIAFL